MKTNIQQSCDCHKYKLSVSKKFQTYSCVSKLQIKYKVLTTVLTTYCTHLTKYLLKKHWLRDKGTQKCEQTHSWPSLLSVTTPFTLQELDSPTQTDIKPARYPVGHCMHWQRICVCRRSQREQFTLHNRRSREHATEACELTRLQDSYTLSTIPLFTLKSRFQFKCLQNFKHESHHLAHFIHLENTGLLNATPLVIGLTHSSPVQTQLATL